MANILPYGNPQAGPRPALVYIVAAVVGLACLGMLVCALSASVPAPAMNLQQAVADFDAGQLAFAANAFRTLAEAGDPHAAYWYGHALDRGLGTTADIKAAMAQYEKAWAGGVVQAGTRLGELYLVGNAIPPDFTQARSYLTAAARDGDTRAEVDIARMLDQGIGAPADPVAAYAWLEVAALRGNAQARLERDRLLPTLPAAQQAQAIQQATAILAAGAAGTSAPHAKA